MNLEQLTKKVEWLEGQKRDSDKLIKSLTRTVERLEKVGPKHKESLDSLSKQINAIEKELRKIDPIAQELAEEKASTKEVFGEQDKKFRTQIEELTQSTLDAQRKLEKEILIYRKELEVLDVLQKDLRERAEIEANLDARLASIEAGLKDLFAAETAREELAAALEQNREDNDERIGKALGLLDAVNERMESVNGIELEQKHLARSFEKVLEQHQKSEIKQREFIENETDKRLKQERIWTEREEKFESIGALSVEVDKRLEELESIDIAVNRAQERFNQLIEKIDRRVNELTEVQRLGEQRVRKEWTTFQSDSQKRWASFLLGQEETSVEAKREREKLAKQIKEYEFRFSDLGERIEHLDEQSEQLMQALLEALRGVISENERYESSLR